MFPSRNFAIALVGSALTLAAGCAVNHPDEVPLNAMLVAEGEGRLLYQAPADGTIYVYDDQEDKLHYSGHVQRNQTLALDPSEDEIKLDAMTASEVELGRNDRHRIYYLREPSGSRRVTTIEERRIER
jgi:hypothetical protein